MKRCVLQAGPIDGAAWRARLDDAGCGAVVCFEGRVRDHNEGRAVLRLEYEAHAPMAEQEGEAIIAEALARWPLGQAFCVHRHGLLELGEVAVLVGVASGHREAAFEAARWIIDEAKRRLPIWKKEHYADGSAEWVDCRHCAHPHHEEKSVA